MPYEGMPMPYEGFDCNIKSQTVKHFDLSQINTRVRDLDLVLVQYEYQIISVVR